MVNRLEMIRGKKSSEQGGWIFLGLLFLFILVVCKKNPTSLNSESPGSDFMASYSNQDARLLVGASYYPWYTEGKHWSATYLRAKLEKPQLPVLGEYDCAKQSVISQHVIWSVDAGIDFWINSWWGPGSSTDRIITDAQQTNSDFRQKMGYCLLYETTGRLGNIPISINAQTIQTFKADLEYICEKHFSKPNYLKIDNKPVLYLYLTRTLDGNYAEFFSQADSLLVQKGYKGLYAVGDEVYWNRQNAEHAKYMDALTCYNPHVSQTWVRDADQFAESCERDLYRPWMGTANSLDIPLWVCIIPGFNDLGVRLEAQHPVIPRNNGELFSKLLKKAKALLAMQRVPLKVLVVTSWNEWHEDTQIEPIAFADPVRKPIEYTTGVWYEGYENTYLDLLKDFASQEK